MLSKFAEDISLRQFCDLNFKTAFHLIVSSFFKAGVICFCSYWQQLLPLSQTSRVLRMYAILVIQKQVIVMAISDWHRHQAAP